MPPSNGFLVPRQGSFIVRDAGKAPDELKPRAISRFCAKFPSSKPNFGQRETFGLEPPLQAAQSFRVVVPDLENLLWPRNTHHQKNRRSLFRNQTLVRGKRLVWSRPCKLLKASGSWSRISRISSGHEIRIIKTPRESQPPRTWTDI